MYHGWNVPAISPENSINYYSSVLKQNGRETGCLVPAVYGSGMAALRQRPRSQPVQLRWARWRRWRESNTSLLEQMTASHVANYRVDMSRPLCPYPQVETYKGWYERCCELRL